MVGKNCFGLSLIGVFFGCGNPNEASYWTKRLDDPAQEVEAVRQLQRIGDPAAIPALAQLFARKRHPDILRAIVSFKDKAGFQKESVVPSLVAALDFSEEEYNSATVATEAIADLGATEAMDALLALLDKPLPVKSRANLAKLAAIQTLLRLKDVRAVDALVRTMERSPEEQDFLLAKKAAEALGEIGGEKAVRPLIRGLFRASTAHKPMFIEASVALLQIGQPAVAPLIAAHQGKDEELNALAKQLEFKPGIVSHKTALVLGDLRAKEAIEPLRATLRAKSEGPPEDPQMSHRGAIVALGLIGTAETLPDVLGALERHPDWHMRQLAAEMLNIHGSPEALPALLKAAKEAFVVQDGDKYDNVRLAAALAFARSAGIDGYAQLQPLVEAIPQEERDGVWDECLTRLEVSRDCKSDARCYAKALDDAVLAKQESAAFHLARLEGAKSELSALAKKVSTKEEIVRLAVLYAVDRLADKQSRDVIEVLTAQIAREKDKRLAAEIVTEMRRTLARIQHK